MLTKDLIFIHIENRIKGLNCAAQGEEEMGASLGGDVGRDCLNSANWSRFNASVLTSLLEDLKELDNDKNVRD